MTRLLALILAAACWAASPAAGATLLPVVTIAGPVVHVGDIFAGAGPRAAEAIVASPPPGTRITYDSDWLAAVAQEHELDWEPGSPLDQVTIVRASRVVDSDAVAQQMLSAIAAQQSVENAEFSLDDPGLSFIVPAEAPPGVAIDGLTIDPHTGRVSAFVSAPAGDPAATRREVTGRLVYDVTVPVLTRALSPGDTIGAGDLSTETVRRDRLPPDCATSMTEIVGKTPRRLLTPGQPVRVADLTDPILVHRDDLVTVVLVTDNLRLTSQAKALVDGTLGAAVRVENMRSNRVLDATVVSAGVVSVSPPGAALDTPRLAQQ